MNTLLKSNQELPPSTPYSPMMVNLEEMETREKVGELEAACYTLIGHCKEVKKRLSEKDQRLGCTLLNDAVNDKTCQQPTANEQQDTSGYESGYETEDASIYDKEPSKAGMDDEVANENKAPICKEIDKSIINLSSKNRHLATEL